LLRGINDDPAVMMDLMRTLLVHRVRPYYLHQMDPVAGTGHFRTPIETGLEIMAALRGRIPGTGVPQFMIDLPGGGGKVPLLPEQIADRSGSVWKIRGFDGRIHDYPVEDRPVPAEEGQAP
jgi:lysine 2,3-aminomutase